MWFEESVAVDELVNEIVVIDGGYGSYGLHGLDLILFEVPD